MQAQLDADDAHDAQTQDTQGSPSGKCTFEFELLGKVEGITPKRPPPPQRITQPQWSPLWCSLKFLPARKIRVTIPIESPEREIPIGVRRSARKKRRMQTLSECVHVHQHYVVVVW